MKQAIIFDLDNTIYPVSAIAGKLFPPLFRLIASSGKHNSELSAIEHDITRKPFQVVARQFGFDESLTRRGIQLLQEMEYHEFIEPFPDFSVVHELPIDKFLVTTGFLKLQQSKVRVMQLENVFKEIHIVDPTSSNQTKKSVFADIAARHRYPYETMLVVGDDLESEIKAAKELGMDAVLYDRTEQQTKDVSVPVISNYHQLMKYL